MITDADLAYLRNINTQPGANAGQSIDPTKPGPTADRIAKLERQIRRTECWTDIPARNARLNQLRAELSRLRNEQPIDVNDRVIAFASAVLHGDDEHKTWLLQAANAFVRGQPLPPPRGKGTAPSPATSPGPQDVRGAESSAWAAFWISVEARGHKYEDMQVGFRAGWQAALAQSPPQNVRKLIEAFSPSNAPPDAQPGSGPEITWFGVKSDA